MCIKVSNLVGSQLIIWIYYFSLKNSGFSVRSLNVTLTRKHSSRMRTGRFCGSGGMVLGVLSGGYCLGCMVPGYGPRGYSPGGYGWWGLTWEGTTRPAPWTDRHLWKHYLPATSFADGNQPIRRESSHKSAVKFLRPVSVCPQRG